jgi:hypothetical protein
MGLVIQVIQAVRQSTFRRFNCSEIGISKHSVIPKMRKIEVVGQPQLYSVINIKQILTGLFIFFSIGVFPMDFVTEKIEYLGWKNCIRMSNQKIELIILTDVGPRIISFKQVGSENIFYESGEHVGKVGNDTWLNYGGHRLWHAPENQPRTYQPDNSVVKFEPISQGIRFTQETEKLTGIQKEMDIYLFPDEPIARVIHRLYNRSPQKITMAPWAISVLKPETVAFLPLPRKQSHSKKLLPVSNISLWAYTDMDDPRLHISKRYIQLSQDPKTSQPIKIGIYSKEGFGFAINKKTLFIKHFSTDETKQYPDRNVNLEAFSNEKFIELETLGHLQKVEPGQQVEHTEYWFLQTLPDEMVSEDTVHDHYHRAIDTFEQIRMKLGIDRICCE